MSSTKTVRLTIAVLLAAVIVPPLTLAEVRVGATDAIKAATKKVQPEYNPVAKQMRVQGDVEVEAHVSEKGDVVDVKVLSGNSLLTASVVKAVKEWKFQPFQDAGKESAAVATLKFNFKM